MTNTLEAILKGIARDCEDATNQTATAAAVTLVVAAPGYVASKRWVFQTIMDLDVLLSALEKAGFIEKAGLIQ